MVSGHCSYSWHSLSGARMTGKSGVWVICGRWFQVQLKYVDIEDGSFGIQWRRICREGSKPSMCRVMCSELSMVVPPDMRLTHVWEAQVHLKDVEVENGSCGIQWQRICREGSKPSMGMVLWSELSTVVPEIQLIQHYLRKLWFLLELFWNTTVKTETAHMASNDY